MNKARPKRSNARRGERQPSATTVSAGTRSETFISAGSAHRPPRAERGQTAVEFAVVAPLMIALLVAIVVFGIAFNNYLALTFATNAGVQALSIARGQTTDPCETTSAAVYAAAPQLTESNLKFTIKLGSNTVASAAANPSCSADVSDMVQSSQANVTVTYPCNINIVGYNPVPNCTLTAQTAMVIQ